MTRDNVGFDNEAFNALMVRVVVVIFAAVAIVLLLGVVTKPAQASRVSPTEVSATGRSMVVNATARP